MSTPPDMVVDRELEGSLRRYVLGILGDQPRLELEERLIKEPAAFDMLGVIEQEVTEDYLEGALSKAEREGYERHFLTSPDRQGMLGFLRALRETAASTASQRAPAPSPSLGSQLRELFRAQLLWQGACVGALVLLVGVSVWSVVVQRELRTQLADLRAQRAPGQRTQADSSPRMDAPPGTGQAGPRALQPVGAGGSPGSASQPAAARALPSAQSIPMFALAAPLLRSEGTLTRVSIPSGTPVVRFRLDVPGEPYASYRVTLYDGNADERCALSGLHTQPQGARRALTIVLPSDLLPRGDYQLKVSGVTTSGGLDPLASYTLRVSGQ